MANLEASNSQAQSSLDKTQVENTEDIETGRSSSDKHMDHAHIERVELTELDVSIPPPIFHSLRRQGYRPTLQIICC